MDRPLELPESFRPTPTRGGQPRQAMSIPASCAAARKLPNRFRTVRSHGVMPAADAVLRVEVSIR